MAKHENHIPHLKTISDFYNQLRIGIPQGDDFSIMRIESQPDSKRIEMPLFRCNFYRLVFFTSPGVEWHLPEEQFRNSINSIYFAYPGKLESWIVDQKVHGYLVCFTEEFAQLDALKSNFSDQYPFFRFEAKSLLHFEEHQAKEVKATLEEMISESSNANKDRKEMLVLLLHRYLIQVRRNYYKVHQSGNSKESQSEAIFNRFKRRVDNHFSLLANESIFHLPSVSLMAREMNINASYLNATIKNLTGATASSHIHKKCILEAKSYLMHTDLQVTEISHKLGFTNVSYFNRFFKKHSHQTPLSFRKKELNNQL